jgi:hypothetical protein
MSLLNIKRHERDFLMENSARTRFKPVDYLSGSFKL